MIITILIMMIVMMIIMMIIIIVIIIIITITTISRMYVLQNSCYGGGDSTERSNLNEIHSDTIKFQRVSERFDKSIDQLINQSTS